MLCHADTCTIEIKLQRHEITKDIKKRINRESLQLTKTKGRDASSLERQGRHKLL